MKKGDIKFDMTLIFIVLQKYKNGLMVKDPDICNIIMYINVSDF